MIKNSPSSLLAEMQTAPTIWPNFFVVGGVKCGTTSMWAYLRRHPDVFLPEVKEPHYFLGPQVLEPGDERVSDQCAGDLDTYRSLYVGAEGKKAIGDASPSYLWDPGAPTRIREVSPDAKIIILLRDPVSRAYARYLMNVIDTGIEHLPFYEALQKDRERERRTWWGARLYVECGLYFEQVQRYLEVFGHDQVLVLLFEELKTAPQQMFTRVAQHLQISPEPFTAIQFSEAYNAFRKPRLGAIHRVGKRFLPEGVKKTLKRFDLFYSRQKPVLDERSKRYLQEIFEPDIVRLESLLGRHLPELRKSWI